MSSIQEAFNLIHNLRACNLWSLLLGNWVKVLCVCPRVNQVVSVDAWFPIQHLIYEIHPNAEELVVNCPAEVS